jgi:hypothetical protein
VRVFFDTNVLVSAFASRGLCAEVLELVLLDHDLILGQNVLRELDKALRAKVKLPVGRSAEIVEFVSSEATQVVDKAEPADANVDRPTQLCWVKLSSAELRCLSPATQRCCGSRIGTLKIVSPRQFWGFSARATVAPPQHPPSSLARNSCRMTRTYFILSTRILSPQAFRH